MVPGAVPGGQIFTMAAIGVLGPTGRDALETIVLERAFLPDVIILVPVSACWWLVVTATE